MLYAKWTLSKELGFSYSNNFGKHLRAICNTAMLRAYNILEALVTRNKSVHLRVYMSLRSLVESSVPIFAPYKKKDICTIEKIQNNFTRKLLLRIGSFVYSRVPKTLIRNKYLRSPSLESRRKVFDICLVLL